MCSYLKSNDKDVKKTTRAKMYCEKNIKFGG